MNTTDSEPTEECDVDETDSRKVDDEPIELDQESYNIDHDHLAKYYIFNHCTFKIKGLSKRHGTENDVKELKKVFKDLNCEPGDKPYEDLPLETIRAKLATISRADYKNYSAVVIVILSHGDEGFIYAKDRPYPLKELWMPFLTEKSSPTLVGKPKIFIIQACQGILADHGVDVPDSVPTTPPHIKIPVFADFLFLYSSPPGFSAFRGANGSWMIQTLCKGLREHKDQLDLQSIFTLVKHFVAYRKQSHNPRRPDVHDKKQIPFEASTLTKKFYLTKVCVERRPRSWVHESRQLDSPDHSKSWADSLVSLPNSNKTLMVFGIALVGTAIWAVTRWKANFNQQCSH